MARKSLTIEKKTLNSPDEVRTFELGKLELVSVGAVTFGRATLHPGWKWSESVKPIVKTEYCEAPHVQYHISGRIRVRMADGTEEEFAPGDVSVLPPGHDAWVVGNEPVVVIDVSGMKEYATSPTKKSVKKVTKARKVNRKRKR